MALIPGAGVYEQQKAEAEAAYQRALAQIAQQRSGVLQNYGFNAQFDDQGNVSSYNVDPYNEYGAYQLSRRSQAADLNSADEEARLRGFNGQHGFGHQATSDLRFAQGYENLGLGRSFLESISGLAGQQADALTSKNQANLGIEQDALYNALQNRLFNPAAKPGDDGSLPADSITPEEAKQMALYGGRAYDSKKSLLSAIRSQGHTPGYWLQHHEGQAEKLGINVPGGKKFFRLKKQRAANAARKFAKTNAKPGTKKYKKLRKQYRKRVNKLGKRGQKQIKQYRRSFSKRSHIPITDGAEVLFDSTLQDPHLSGPR